MTPAHRRWDAMGAARCDMDDCGHFRIFSIQLDEADIRTMMARIMSAAGWLQVNGRWMCDRCARAALIGIRIGLIDLEESVAIESAVMHSEQLLRIRVTP